MSRVAEEEGGGKKIREKLNGKINGCQSIPGVGASGEGSEEVTHIETARGTHI